MDLEQRSINVGKALIMDTVRNANSGHTGGPLSSFDFAYVLFKDFLTHCFLYIIILKSVYFYKP